MKAIDAFEPEQLRSRRAREAVSAIMHIIQPYLKDGTVEPRNFDRCGQALFECFLAGNVALITEDERRMLDEVRDLTLRVAHIEGHLVL